ncbi:hypothetical protein [Absidia glauca]|uniref:Cytochrome P450 n=1 Tax=Absidia glauca TaxID=4829 RepID=A0A168SD21_ABSGL|nr:hypothetical protein [Absidia glauca]
MKSSPCLYVLSYSSIWTWHHSTQDMDPRSAPANGPGWTSYLFNWLDLVFDTLQGLLQWYQDSYPIDIWALSPFDFLAEFEIVYLYSAWSSLLFLCLFLSNNMTVAETFNNVQNLYCLYAPRRLEKDQMKKFGLAVTMGWVSYKLMLKIYDAYWGPLCDIPGPFLGKFFTIPLALTDFPRGTNYLRMKKLHDKYGPIVKISPTKVTISDKDWIKEALVKVDLQKGPAYDALRDKGRQSIFSTRDKVFHKQRRRIVSPAFSVKYINSLEPYMDSCVEAFVNRIDRDIVDNGIGADGYGKVDIWALMGYLALDMIGSTAFGGTFDMVGSNNHFIPVAITRTMRIAPQLVMYPFIRKIIRLNPSSKFEKFMLNLVNNRIHSGERRDDILQILVDSQQADRQEDRLTMDDIIAEVLVFLVAGSETTSSTMGFALIELLRHPDKFEKLRAEIDNVPLNNGNDSTLHSHSQLKNLPYLNAVLNETMRLHMIGSNGLQRMTDSDITLGNDVVIPKNTVVFCNVNHAQRNPDYWPNPETFLPERWLNDADVAPCLDAFNPFSAGSRNCVGKQFAFQEMRLTLVALISRYDFMTIPEEMDAAQDIRQFITLTVEKNSLKVLMKHRAG